MALPETLTCKEAEVLVRELADLSWPVQFKKHLESRTQSRDVELSEVWLVLRRGSVTSDPRWDDEYRDWKVDIEMTQDDVYLRLHVAIDEERPGGHLVLHVLTVIARDL